MATTPSFSLRYPQGSDPVDVATDLYKLAIDIDGVLNTQVLKIIGGTLTGDLTISKANAALTVNASSGNADLILKSVAATQSRLYLQTGSTARWSINKNSSAESGSNAGSNLEINAYNDAGTLLSTPLSIARSTGAATFGNTIAASGLAGSLLSSASPVMNGTASAGTAVVPSRQDHVHPSDTSRAALSGATFTGDVTVSKASPVLDLAATSGSVTVVLRAASGSAAGVQMTNASGALRWYARKDNTAESGGNAGSNLAINRYDDAGVNLGSVAAFDRATGRATLGSVGASAGIEYGTNGPRDMVGTGSPEGVVTAPVGSTWRDTNATTGAIKWIKASGTGSTGWKVEYGDTGWRDMAAVPLLNGWTVGARWQMRRVGNTVRYNGVHNAAAATHRVFYFLPAGFRPANWEYLTVLYGTTIVKSLETYSDGQMSIYSYAAGDHYISTSWLTSDPWPTSLPGTAA